jgi:hypothetical protein
LIGRSPSSAITDGALLSWIVYSRLPIFCVPTGVIRFCARARWRRPVPRARAPAWRPVEIDLHLPDFAAVGKRNGGARHGDERRAHHVEAEVGERLLGQPEPDSASWMIGTVEAL